MTMEGDDFLVRRRSAGYNARPFSKQLASAVKISDSQVKVIKKVLAKVCTQCDLRHAEVLYPAPTGMVVTKASWSAGPPEEDFHARSTEFMFPMQVGIPGRVWMHRHMEWHPDVSSLPAHKYLRKEIATDARLKGCVAVPFEPQVDDVNGSGTSHILVFIFYTDRVLAEGDDVDAVVSAFEAAKIEIVGMRQDPNISSNELDAVSESEEVEEESAKEVEVLSSILKVACMEGNFPYAEALRPLSSGMALSRARFAHGLAEEKFYQESKAFTFPLMVGIPGRVWKKRRVEWNPDVTAMPAFKFLRRQMAISAELKGCVGLPLVVEDELFVVMFFSRKIIDTDDVRHLLASLAALLSEQEAAGEKEEAAAREKSESRVTFEVERRVSMTSRETDEESELSELEWGVQGEGLEGSSLGSQGSGGAGVEEDAQSDTRSTKSEGMEDDLDGLEAEGEGEVKEEEVTVEGLVGQGRTTEVHRALFSSLVVAAKTVAASYADDADELRALLREAAVLRAVRHPQLLSMVGCCLRRSPPVILYELCQCSLEAYAEKKRSSGGWTLSLRRVVKWGGALAAALEYLHAHGVVHRDIKPSTVLVSRNGESIKVSGLALCAGEDPELVAGLVREQFGEAAGAAEAAGEPSGWRLTETSGAFRYLAPEVFEGDGMSAGSDVFAAGLLLWFLCAGEHPFPDASPDDLAEGCVHAAQARPDLSAVSDLSPPLADAIRAAWAHDPAARPSAAELRERLARIRAPPLEWPAPAAFRLSSFARWRGSPRVASAN